MSTATSNRPNVKGASTTFKTRNDVPDAVRQKMITLLNARLADVIDLRAQAKQAHWNVKGPAFIALHKLFDKIADATGEYIDEIAERAVQLGGTAEGDIRVAAQKSTLKPYPQDAVDGPSHVEALTAAMSATAMRTRAAINTATELDDLCTADLFTEVTRELDKYMWFVEAHSHADQ